MKGIKKAVLGIDVYSVNQDFSKVKLNQNESSIKIPVKIKEEIFRRIKDLDWNRYPSKTADSLIEKIADYTDFAPSGIIAGNGSNELIQTLIFATCNSGDKILVVKPCFSIYKRIASIMNIDVIEIPLKDDFSFDVEAIIEKGREVKLIILDSPNNPTGKALKIKEIDKIAINFDGIVAVDEAYYEFHKQTAQESINKLQNIVVIRTFSKALMMAGARIGYLLGTREIVGELLKAKLPFSLGIFQQVAGRVILENKRIIGESVRKIIKERERLLGELKKIMDIQPFPSCANFILFETKGKKGKDLYKILYENGVVIRYFEISRLKNMLRVTVGTHEENDIFLEKLRRIIERRLW